MCEALSVCQKASHLSCYTSYRLLMLETFEFIRREILIEDANEVKKNSHEYAKQKKQIFRNMLHLSWITNRSTKAKGEYLIAQERKKISKVEALCRMF